MRKIDAQNYRATPPAEIKLGPGGTATLIEVGLRGLVEIGKYIAVAIGQRRQLKLRVEALENSTHAQQQINEKLMEEIEYLKTQIIP